MKPRHIIKRSAAALALIGLLTQPAQAQIPVVDSAAISLQVQSWANNLAEWVKNLEEWKKDATRWLNEMKSKLGGELGGLSSSADPAQRRKHFDAAVQRMRSNNACGKITDTNSQNLCTQEQELKVQRAQLLLKIMDESQANLAKLNKLIGEYNSLVSSATSENSNEGKIRSKAEEISAVQQDINNRFAESEKEFKVYEEQINVIHSVRVDYGATQISGKTPGVFDKLISTATVAALLTEEESRYKNKIEAKKAQTSGY